MKILGIDPGTATTGYGIITTKAKACEVITWGLIETDKEVLSEKRLENIYLDTLKLLKVHSPDVIAIEKIFFATNAKTAMAVGQAQGVLLLAAARSKLPVIQYAPGTIKKLITGNGRATKKEIQKAVRKILGNKVKSKRRARTHFDNCADALAVALCYAMKEGEING